MFKILIPCTSTYWERNKLCSLIWSFILWIGQIYQLACYYMLNSLRGIFLFAVPLEFYNTFFIQRHTIIGITLPIKKSCLFPSHQFVLDKIWVASFTCLHTIFKFSFGGPLCACFSQLPETYLKNYLCYPVFLSIDIVKSCALVLKAVFILAFSLYILWKQLFCEMTLCNVDFSGKIFAL